MKKTIAISFLLLFVFANTELHQLLKLPVLLHHYIDHRQTDRDISFVDFVKKHYGHNNHSHSDDHEHNKLPFKSSDCGIVHTSTALYKDFGFSFDVQPPVLSRENHVYAENPPCSAAVSNIWQPPKAAWS